MTFQGQSSEIGIVKAPTGSGDSSDVTSRSSSETTSSDNDDIKGRDLRFGWCAFKPAGLQWLNNIVGAVAFISLANGVQGFAYGLFGVLLSTIEKRFDLSSSQSSFVVIAYEIGAIPLIMLFTVIGARIHRPISISLGLLSVAVGCVMFFVPQFTTPPYRPQGSGLRPDETCGGNRSTCVETEDGESLSYYLPVFFIARLLIGIGSTPVLTIGVNYMDDCSTREKFAKYCGVYMALSVAGPSLGFFFGASILSVFSDFYLFSNDEIGITSGDSSWIGCWWLPYTVAAALCLLNAVPLWGYPRDLPGAAELRANKTTEAHNDSSSKSTSVPNKRSAQIESCAEFGTMAISVLTNPTYLALTVYSIFDKLMIGGLIAYGPKLFQYGLKLTPTAAGIIYASTMLPFGVAGNLIGGFVIERMRLSFRHILVLQTLLAAFTTLVAPMFLLMDDTVDFAGITVPYNSSLAHTLSSPSGLLDSCNANCTCDRLPYDPICSHDNVQFYSQCYAGCRLKNATSSSTYVNLTRERTVQYALLTFCHTMRKSGTQRRLKKLLALDKNQEYSNCSCITAPIEGALPIATSGQCSSPIGTKSIIFLAIYCISTITLNWGTVSNTAATLRCVTSSQTTFAFSMQLLISKLAGTIPGPLLMGMIFDKACLLWRPLSVTCDSDIGVQDGGGSCVLYDNNTLIISVLVLIIVCKGLTCIATIIALIVYRQPSSSLYDANQMDVVEVRISADIDGRDSIRESKEQPDSEHSTPTDSESVKGSADLETSLAIETEQPFQTTTTTICNDDVGRANSIGGGDIDPLSQYECKL